MRLITHALDSGESDGSSFLSELIRVADSSSLEIACPYMAVDILENVLKRTERIRIVTDAEAWLRAYSRPKRKAILDFIKRRIDSIRHYRGVHAKVAISPQRLLFGSANFTESGLHENEELSGVTESADLIADARNWFTDLWERAVTIDLAALRRYESGLPAASADAGPKRQLPPPTPRRRKQPDSAVRTPLKSERELIEYLRAIPDGAEWVAKYFDLVGLVYKELGLETGDQRVALTMPRSEWLLPLSINNRYSLFPLHDGQDVRIAILAPDGTVDPGKRWHGAEYLVGFGATPKDEGTPPIVVTFPRPDMVQKPQVVRAWRNAMARQLEYGKRSANRTYHSEAALRACLDVDYRQFILKEAYGAAA